MRRHYASGVVLCLAALVLPATAELQNVQVGGELRIKLDLIYNWTVQPRPFEVRIPAFLLPNRPIGEFLSGAPVDPFSRRA